MYALNMEEIPRESLIQTIQKIRNGLGVVGAHRVGKGRHQR